MKGNVLFDNTLNTLVVIYVYIDSYIWLTTTRLMRDKPTAATSLAII